MDGGGGVCFVIATCTSSHFGYQKLIKGANFYTFLHPAPANFDKDAEKLASSKASAAIESQAHQDSNIDQFLCMKMQEIHFHHQTKANYKAILSQLLLAAAGSASMWKISSNQTSFSSYHRYAGCSSHHTTTVTQCMR